MPRRRRRTKIIATLGPACAGKVLEHLLEAGVNVVRLNFSHGSHAEHAAWIERVQRYRQAAGRPVAILQDLGGPKVRIGEFAAGQTVLEHGQEFTLTSVCQPGQPTCVSVDYPEIVADSPVGSHILLADGSIELRVEEKSGETLRCRVLTGGVLRSHAGINFPHHSLSIPALTDKDREDLRFGVEMGVDFIALSYVRSAEDILEARQLVEALQADTPIIAKVEKHEAVNALPEILAVADGLMVARGDLGLEMPLERVPIIQKEIIAAANQAGKPVITATQMLLSMVEHSRPSRAEVTDVANAILDGSDAVMLSEETAAGKFPVEAVRFLDRISRATEPYFPHAVWLRERAGASRREISDAISFAAAEMAQNLEAAAILTSTDFGTTARLISRFRPAAPIIAVTPRAATWRRLALSWGVFPLLARDLKDTDHMFAAVKEEALKTGWLKEGDPVVITAGTPLGQRGSTNLIKADVV